MLSGIAPDVAAANAASFGSGASEHWEDARALLIQHKRLLIQTGRLAGNGHLQSQPGHLADALIRLQCDYAHLQHGGWRSTTSHLPGLEPFDCWKPDRPRLGSDRRLDKRTGRLRQVERKPVKYESQPAHPRGGGLFVPVVPLPQWQAIARRAGLPEPDAAAIARGFWAWVIEHPKVPVVVVEGFKKTLAAISCGHAAVGLPGVTMGWRTDNSQGTERRLIRELLALAQPDRPLLVAFDRERKESTATKVEAAASTLCWLLRIAGAAAAITHLPLLQGQAKTGVDDLVVAQGAEALDAVLVAALAAAQSAPAIAPAVPRLRRFDLEAPEDRFLGEVLQIPTDRKLVCLAAGMGAGKTELLAAALEPLMAAGVRVVLITHRRSLGAALAERLGLPWGDDALPGSDLRQTGIALCVDSLCRQSALRFNAADWRDSIVVIDEAAQVLLHALQARGTAIARRRPEVLDSLGQLLTVARAVWVADAQLDNNVVRALEGAVGERAFLIGSKRLPAAGRELVNHDTRASWMGALVALLQHRKRVWIATTAAEGDSPNSATNFAKQVEAHWPGCRVLLVDRDTVADPNHPAHHLARDPGRVVADYDVVVASPAIAAGLSVTLPGHFDAVLAAAGGTTPPADIAQALSRVRDDCPRHLYAPRRSPSTTLQIGCGSLDPQQVLKHLDRHAQAAVAAALAAGWDADTGRSGPWLQLWAAQAAQQNRGSLTYRDTVLALLEREGYRVVAPAAMDADTTAMAQAAGEELKQLAQAAAEKAQAAVIDSRVLTDKEAEDLQRRRRRLKPAEKAQLQRWRINRDWNLKGAAPSPELLKAHADGAPRKVVMRWAVTDSAADVVVARHDRELAKELAPTGHAWAPDLADGLLAPRIAALRALGLPQWLQRDDWFGADDPEIEKLAATATSCTNDVVQLLGLRPAKKALTVLRQLLGAIGMKLEAKRLKGAAGRDAYRYRVVPIPLPDQVPPDRVVAAWVARMDGPKNPLQKEQAVLAHA
ncbi:MAG: hypothetical protein RLZZ106_143 [Cyanobacteriota bacterium]